jgi:serine/threonine protein kinase
MIIIVQFLFRLYQVYQAKQKSTNEIFAIKILRKDLLIKTTNVEYTRAEKDILRRIKHPFIVDLHCVFQNDRRIYLVMDFVNGGQLFFHLREEAMFSEDVVRFYIAELVVALEFLHSRNIVHR